MPDAISLLINLALLTLNKAKKKLERTSEIFISFQDCLSWCASQKLFLSPKLTSSNDFLISIAAVFTTFRKEFITPFTSIGEEKANDWFFLFG